MTLIKTLPVYGYWIDENGKRHYKREEHICQEQKLLLSKVLKENDLKEEECTVTLHQNRGFKSWFTVEW